MAQSYRPYVKETDYNLFMNGNFEVLPFCSSRFENCDANILSRIINSFTDALAKFDKLPRYMMVVLERDFLDFLGYKEFRASSLYGEWINYLAGNIATICQDRKQALPQKARRLEFPMIYWAALPHHKNFNDNTMRTKFNNCIESVMKVHEGKMRLIKIKEIWDYNDISLVDRYGNLTSHGTQRYWAAVDAVFKFNVLKHESFIKALNRNDVTVKKPHASRYYPEDRMKEFFNKYSKDKYHWRRGQHKSSRHHKKHFRLPSVQ